MNNKIINNTIDFVKDTLKNYEGGHDWYHTYRVWNNVKNIGSKENVDMLVVELSALLHNIADSKFHNGDEEIGSRLAGEFLQKQGLDKNTIEHIQNIIKYIPFKNTLSKNQSEFDSLELQVVQDADKLDALGAMGIARTFNYGGFIGRGLYDPDIKPRKNMTKQEYKTNEYSSINHFYEKLLLLKDMMNTKTGKILAEQRHKFMESYLEEFYNEWEGKR